MTEQHFEKMIQEDPQSKWHYDERDQKRMQRILNNYKDREWKTFG